MPREKVDLVQFKNILCPTDFSENAVHALRYASALSKYSGASVDCVYDIDLGYGESGLVHEGYLGGVGAFRSIEDLEEDARGKLAKLKEATKTSLGLDLTTHIREGNIVQEILKVAELCNTDLIIVATHGRHGLERFLLGSTCDGIIRTSAMPVLSIKPSEREIVSGGDGISISTILCPMDFSKFSKSALPYATALARDFGSKIILAHVVDERLDYPEWTPQATANNSRQLAEAAREDLEELAGTIGDIETEVQIGFGVPHRVLIGKVDRLGVDTSVMPTHGRAGLTHALLGSVAERVARMANCPVLTVRPREEE